MKVSDRLQQLVLNAVKASGAEAILHRDNDNPSPEFEKAVKQLMDEIAVLEDKAWRYDELCH